MKTKKDFRRILEALKISHSKLGNLTCDEVSFLTTEENEKLYQIYCQVCELENVLNNKYGENG